MPAIDVQRASPLLDNSSQTVYSRPKGDLAAYWSLILQVDLLSPDSPLSEVRRAQLGGEQAILDRWPHRFPGA